MKKVSFTRLRDGTAEDYAYLYELEEEYCRGVVDRLMAHLKLLDESLSGYQVSRLEHCLQGATRAVRAGEDDEMVVAILLHDIGDMLAPHNHQELAAAILRPYVSEKTAWIIGNHAEFQKFYYADKLGWDKDARDKFAGHPWFEDAVRFCELYDENCFDPDYDSMTLEEFRPALVRIFARKAFDPAHLKPSVAAE